MNNIWSKIADLAIEAGIKLVLALIVFTIGRIVIKKMIKLFEKGKFQEKLDPTARSFFLHFIHIGLYVVLVVSIIAILGVPMASVITVLASAGVAIGLALQGALGNVAGSLMILIFRPFSVGDYILANGEGGTVKAITMFYTIMDTVDLKEVTIPNGVLMNSNIVNYTKEQTRMVMLPFNIAKGVPVDDVKKAILDAVAKSSKALDYPAPFVGPNMPVSGGLEYTVRVWVKTEDYWDVYFELMEAIPAALVEANIPSPAPSNTIIMAQ